jgi:dTDP-4-dehydrorhamnose 3,5-epimerase
MKITQTDIDSLLVIEPKVFGDHRGWFLESYNEKVFKDKLKKK